VDFEGLDQRILTIPVGNGFFTSLQTGNEGGLYYLRLPAAGFGINEPPCLRRYALDKREEETLLEGAGAYVLSHDRKKPLVRAGQSWHIAPAGKVNPA
jgi:tricorn protease